MTSPETCNRCRGTGADPEPSPEAVSRAMLTDSMPIPCSNCDGSGDEPMPCDCAEIVHTDWCASRGAR